MAAIRNEARRGFSGVDVPYPQRTHQETFYPLRRVQLIDGIGRTNFRAYEEVASVLSNAGVAVVDFGHTFGVIFDTKIREKVGELRGEKKDQNHKYVPISLVSTWQTASEWIDFSQTPLFARDIERLAYELEGEAFLRLPALPETKKALGSYSVSTVMKDGKYRDRIQFFFLSHNDPLMKALSRQNPPLSVIGVRSSNMEGEPEKWMPDEALNFALTSGADIYAQRLSHHAHISKEIKGSVPIIEIPTFYQRRQDGGEIVFRIVRRGNIHPDVLRRQIQSVFPNSKVFEQPEKEDPTWRTQYHSSHENPRIIKHDIKRKSGLPVSIIDRIGTIFIRS
jgi:hypothetical protein